MNVHHNCSYAIVAEKEQYIAAIHGFLPSGLVLISRHLGGHWEASGPPVALNRSQIVAMFQYFDLAEGFLKKQKLKESQ